MSTIMRMTSLLMMGLLPLIGGPSALGAGAAGLAGCAKRCTREEPRAAGTRPSGREWTSSLQPHELPGPREPSGAVALPDLGGILVVDDEPSDSPSEGIHFLRVTGDDLVPLPVRFTGEQRQRWDDWEGATSDGQRVYLLGSHAHRDARRSQICSFGLASTRATSTHLEIGVPIRCMGGTAQRRDMEQTLDRAARKHGFTLPDDWRHRRPKKGGLNIEGIHFHRPSRTFYLGLRSPLATVGGQSHAILLTMQPSTGQATIAFAGLVDLRDRGVRALGAGPDDSILISAGRVGKGGPFDLYVLRTVPPSPFRLKEPALLTPRGMNRQYAWFKPEALVLYSQDLFVFSDSGEWSQEPAHYLRLPWRDR